LIVFVPISLFSSSAREKATALFEAKKYEEAKVILKVVSEKSAAYADARYYLGSIR
jgi:hypothetical protein